jgi:hypothetical protein
VIILNLAHRASLKAWITLDLPPLAARTAVDPLVVGHKDITKWERYHTLWDNLSGPAERSLGLELLDHALVIHCEMLQNFR